MRGGNVVSSLQEVITDSAASGAPVHVVHINSAATAKTPIALQMIAGARARGLDVTTEAYPYTASMTEIASAAYSNWEQREPEFFSRLLWPATGERLTRESFERYRRQGGFVISFGNTEEMVRAAIADPNVMIASDGIIENGKGHPRGAGTFARVLGRYVREEKALTLMDAIRKSSLMPAQRLEPMSPQMRRKGRLQVGADADIAVFDADHVIDKATYENAAQYSDGFRYVLVEGTFVVRDGKLQEGATPGQGVRAQSGFSAGRAPPAMTYSSAASTSGMLCGRNCRSFVMHRMTKSASGSGVSVRISRTSRGCSARCAANAACPCLAANGERPVSNSYPTIP
jgi:dihydroorotase